MANDFAPKGGNTPLLSAALAIPAGHCMLQVINKWE